MFCPRCEAEYRPGFHVCSDCDVPLVETLDGVAFEQAPEDPSALEPFHETESSSELGAILEAFEARGVPYVVQAGTALSLLAGRGRVADLPEEWRAHVLVPGAARREAREALAEMRAAARDAGAAAPL